MWLGLRDFRKYFGYSPNHYYYYFIEIKIRMKKNQLKKIELKIDFNQYKKLKFCDFSYFCKLWMVLTEKWNGKKSVINVKYVRKKY